jgi:hypothetical protein
MKTVILRTHKRTKSNSFSDADRDAVRLFSKLGMKPTKPIIALSSLFVKNT